MHLHANSVHSAGIAAAINACSRLIPASPSGNRRRAQPSTSLVDDLDVVMILAPAITDEQHPGTSSIAAISLAAARRRHPAIS